MYGRPRAHGTISKHCMELCTTVFELRERSLSISSVIAKTQSFVSQSQLIHQTKTEKLFHFIQNILNLN